MRNTLSRKVLLGLVLLSLSACAPQARVTATSRLQDGLAALEAGDYAAAVAACRQSALALPEDPSPASCWLLAALHLGDWPEAREAAGRLASSRPGEAWPRAVEADLALRSRPDETLAIPVEDPSMAWACLSPGCSPTMTSEARQRLGPYLSALLDWRNGERDLALAALQGVPPGSEPWDLYLLLLLSQGKHDELWRLIPRGCKATGQASDVEAQLALFLGEESLWDAEGGRTTQGRAAELAGQMEARLKGRGHGAEGPSPPGAQLGRALSLFLQASARRNMDAGERARLLEAAATAEAGRAVYRLAAGAALMRAGEFARAAHHLERALAIGADGGCAGALLILAHLVRGDLAAALNVVEVRHSGMPESWQQLLLSLAAESK
jgi:Tfp pilus assembly protein PilF